MKKIILSLVICFVSFASLALASEKNQNTDLQEEIDIMESALITLTGNYGADARRVGFGVSANGFYLSGYGVIFNVTHNIGIVIPGEDKRLFSGSDVNNVKVITRQKNKSPQSDVDVKDKSRQEKSDIDPIPEIKRNLEIFFTWYATSMSELESDEKISVILNITGQPYLFPNGNDDRTGQLTATVSMKDIESHRKGKISPDELKKRILFNEVKQANQETAIFSSVLQTSLSYVNKEPAYDFRNSIESISIPGYGVIFTVDADKKMEFAFLNESMKSLEKNLKVLEKELKSKKMDIGKIEKTIENFGNPDNTDYPSPEKNTVDFKEYEDKLINVISKYGHTLSNIKEDEYIAIAVNFNRKRKKKENSFEIINVKKSHVNDFYRGKIDFEGFREQVSIVTY